MDVFEMKLSDLADDFYLEELFECANRIKILMPWLWMSEDLILVVEEPDTKRLGFVSILGQQSNHFAVNVYDGIEGYKSFMEVLKEPIPDSSNPLFIKKVINQNVLTVSFENREDLTDLDYALIKSLGLSFRGEKQWPRFRKLEKGCPEDALTYREDIEFLSYCLEEVHELINEINDKQLKVPTDGSHFLGRFIGEDDIETRVKAIACHQKTPLFTYRQDILIYKLNKLPFVDMVWEGIQYYIPSRMLDSEEENFIYPYFTAFVNQEDGQAIFLYTGQNDNMLPKEVCEEFSKMLLELGFKPKSLLVEDEALHGIFKHYCEQLGITCAMNQDVLAAKQFMNETFEIMKMQMDSFNDMFDKFENPNKLEVFLDGLSDVELRHLTNMLENGDHTQITNMLRELTGDYEVERVDELSDDAIEDYEDEKELVEILEEVETRCQAFLKEFSGSMTSTEKEYFIPIVLMVTELMASLFGEVPTEWSVSSLEEVCLSILIDNMDEKAYSVVGNTLVRYMFLQSKLIEMEQSDELIAYLQEWFHLNGDVHKLF